MRVVVALSASIALLSASTTQPPKTARDELLAADSQLGAAQPDVMLPDKLLAAFSTNVHFFAGGEHVHGKDAARALLATNPANPTSTIEWSAIAGDVSADGTNGYTYGLTDQHRADGSLIAGKYLAYWVRENGAWRIAAFKRNFRASGRRADAQHPARAVESGRHRFAQRRARSRGRRAGVLGRCRRSRNRRGVFLGGVAICRDDGRSDRARFPSRPQRGVRWRRRQR